jgi:hypothetical protein
VIIPRWIAALVGGLVIVFGVYRMSLAFRSDEDDERARARGGLYGFGRRTHLLFGLLYLLMGVVLMLGVFGVHVLPKLGK